MKPVVGKYYYIRIVELSEDVLDLTTFTTYCFMVIGFMGPLGTLYLTSEKKVGFND